jgi:hypothetical protein
MPAFSMSAVRGKADTLTTHTTVFQMIATSFRNQVLLLFAHVVVVSA